MRKILIVNSEDTRNAKTILETDYEVICASTGEEAIEMFKSESPDLILSSVQCSDMSGYDMHKKIVEINGDYVPIMYITQNGTEDTETRIFDKGASDFLRTPYRADDLKNRIDNIFTNMERIRDLTEEATIDKLTGFLNKSASDDEFPAICKSSKGSLLILDLDNFKPVNDIYGHETGDSFLMGFADLLKSNISENDTVGRIGGDEFVLFLNGISDERTIASFIDRVNKGILTTAYTILGNDMPIPIGISAGVVIVPREGNDYDDLFRKADKALYLVKQNGKHGYFIYKRYSSSNDNIASSSNELKHLSMIFDERSSLDGALWLGQEAFGNVYHFLIRYVQSYHGVAYKVLFTLLPSEEDMDRDLLSELSQYFGEILSKSLRKSDIMLQSKPNQFFILLPDLVEEHVQDVVKRLTAQWKETDYADKASIICETDIIMPEEGNGSFLNRRSS